MKMWIQCTGRGRGRTRGRPRGDVALGWHGLGAVSSFDYICGGATKVNTLFLQLCHVYAIDMPQRYRRMQMAGYSISKVGVLGVGGCKI